MVNNSNEKLIKFPMSEWMIQSGGFTKVLPQSAYCICYQYNIDDNGFGPYSFSTTRSDRLLSFLFPNILFFYKNENKLESSSKIDKRGVYFYGNNNGEIDKKTKEYNKLILKNKFRANKGLPEETLVEKPPLLELYSGNTIEVNVVNELIKNNFHFLFNCFFTPMAGQTLILFDHDVWVKATEYCKDNKICVQEVNSIDDLNSW